MEGVMDEVVELFPSSYIHIGGDECPKTAREQCEHCQKLIRELGLENDITPNPVDGRKHTKEEKLQSYIVSRVEKYRTAKDVISSVGMKYWKEGLPPTPQ